MSIKVGKSFKALIAAGAALVMAASMAACGPSAGTPSEAKSSDTGTSSSANAKARSLDEIKKSGKIKIAVFSDKAPFGYVDKDGKYQGYDVYFAEQLAKDLGVDPEYTSVDPAAVWTCSPPTRSIWCSLTSPSPMSARRKSTSPSRT